jgi:hypothetical protein
MSLSRTRRVGTLFDGRPSTSSTNKSNRSELDSHADTCCAGINTVPFAYSEETVSVSPFIDDYSPLKNVKIASVVTAYDDPITGDTLFLVIHEALYFGAKLPQTLLNPNQLRSHGNRVHDVPKQFEPDSKHAIEIPHRDLTLPLGLDGIISYLPTRKPTPEEMKEFRAQPQESWIELTSDVPWKPYSKEFREAENRLNERQMASVQTERIQHKEDSLSRSIGLARSTRDRASWEHPSEETLYDRLIMRVNVASDDIEGDGLDGRQDSEIYPTDDVDRNIMQMKSSERGSVVTKEILARRWGIGIETAKRTLQSTTQAGIRKILHPSERRVRTRQNHLRFPNLNARFYSDTMFAAEKSTRGNTCAQIFTNGSGYSLFYPLERKQHAHRALTKTIQDVGIMRDLTVDGAGEVNDRKSDWGQIVKEYRINQRTTEPHSPWQNKAEAEIREVKKGIRRATRRTGSPFRLWDYCGQWVSAIRRLTAHDVPTLEGRVPAELIEGNTPDISEYAQFDWYQPVWYVDPAVSFPTDNKKLGRWIGVAHDVGAPLTSWILPASGRPVARSTVSPFTEEDAMTPAHAGDLVELDRAIAEKIGNKRPSKEVEQDFNKLHPEIPDDIFLPEKETEPYEPEAAMPEADEYTPETFDKYISAEVMLPVGGDLKRAKVTARKQDDNGNPVGLAHNNPILDTRLYEVEFPDGSTDAFSANVIAESMYSQIDDEGHSYQLLQEIIDHKSDGNAVVKDDGFTEQPDGTRMPRMTTKGWKLLVQWKDGTSNWIPLKDLKESNPVETAEYAVANKIAEEPAFAWWIRKVLRRRDRIIKKVKARYWRRTHKYGIELPKSVKEALKVDAMTGTDFWKKAIDKEMRNVKPAFEFKDNNKVPIGYKHIDCHMIFDVKLDLTRKARFVAGGHQTDPPKDMVYSSVVSRDSVRLAFLLAALNDLKILSADVQNAYLNAPTTERVYTTAGEEFGKDKVGRPVLIVRALYGLKSSGARWRDHMAATLRDGGYQSCQADPDVWMKPGVKPDGTKYWEYVLCYVDDILVISHKPKEAMAYLQSRYTLKEGSVKEPEQYLGAKIKKWYIHGSDDPTKPRWAMSSETYVKRAIADVETELGKVDKMLPTKASTPLSAGYRPELDQSNELDPRRASYFQGVIGVLRWACELGRIDILVSVSMLSRYLAAPREGHLQQVFHIFGYLKSHDKSTLVFDDTEPDFASSHFKKCDWGEFYPNAQEAIPLNAPEPRGKEVTTSCFVDADHAGCRVTRRSHTGIIIFVNRAPIIWYSKRQNTVETSTFGSEFVAMRIAVELVEGLRYKLRMMGVPIDGPTALFCDNEAVVTNSTAPESTLKKKHNAIAYHRTREANAAGIVKIAKEDGDTNLADILTKLMAGPRLKRLASYVLW